MKDYWGPCRQPCKCVAFFLTLVEHSHGICRGDNPLLKNLTKVCVQSANPRTASLFSSNYMALRWKGRFKYVPGNRMCPPTRPWIVLGEGERLPNATIRVITGDEGCVCKAESCGDVQNVQFRQYHSSHYQTWASAHGKSKTIWHPLGPRYEFGTIPREKVRPSDQRQLLFNMIVSPTSRARTSLYAALKHYVNKGAFGKHKIYLHMTPEWRPSLNGTGYVSVPEYKELLVNSLFTLCPIGHNPEQFRIFEAMEGGSIPVFSRAEVATHKCENALGPFEGTPVLFVHNWQQLPAKLIDIVSNPARLAEWHRRFLAWVDTFWQNATERFECVFSVRDAWQTATQPDPHCAAVAAAAGLKSGAL